MDNDKLNTVLVITNRIGNLEIIKQALQSESFLALCGVTPGCGFDPRSLVPKRLANYIRAKIIRCLQRSIEREQKKLDSLKEALCLPY